MFLFLWNTENIYILRIFCPLCNYTATRTFKTFNGKIDSSSQFKSKFYDEKYTKLQYV